MSIFRAYDIDEHALVDELTRITGDESDGFYNQLNSAWKGYTARRLDQRMVDGTTFIRLLRLANNRVLLVVAELTDTEEFPLPDGQMGVRTHWDFHAYRSFEPKPNGDDVRAGKELLSDLHELMAAATQNLTFGWGNDDVDAAGVLAEDDNIF